MINADGADCVYRHYDAEGALLYIGVSNDVPRRLEQHKKYTDWAKYVARTTAVSFDTREEAILAERDAIERESPLYNRAYSFPEFGVDNSSEIEMSALEFKSIRHSLKVTQTELAIVLGYSGPMEISKFERETNPREVPPLLARLMRAYIGGYRPDDWPKK